MNRDTWIRTSKAIYSTDMTASIAILGLNHIAACRFLVLLQRGDSSVSKRFLHSRVSSSSPFLYLSFSFSCFLYMVSSFGSYIVSYYTFSSNGTKRTKRSLVGSYYFYFPHWIKCIPFYFFELRFVRLVLHQ